MDMSLLRFFFQPDQQAIGGLSLGWDWPLQVGVPECADGNEALALAHDGHQVFACDPDSLAVARARQLGCALMLVDAAATQALPWPSHSLDLCVLPRGWNGPLNDVLRVLRPGGALYLRQAPPELRTRLALAGIAWFDQLSCSEDTLLAFTQPPADCCQDAAESHSCCDPAASGAAAHTDRSRNARRRQP